MKKLKHYKFWGVEYDHYPSDFERGFQMVIQILFFPLWCVPYLIYLVICYIGKSDGKPKLIREEEDLEEETYY